ncbi:MAG: hypothetical protein ACOCTG_04725 [Bacteroidota bacterium]
MEKEADVNPASEESLEVYDPTPVVRAEHAESTFTRLIEQQTAKIPSEVFLFAALSSMMVSLGLHLGGRKDASRFIGMWAPALLIMGVYNKLVKILRPQ